MTSELPDLTPFGGASGGAMAIAGRMRTHQPRSAAAPYAAAAVAKKAVEMTPTATPIAMAIRRDLRMAALLPNPVQN